MIQLKVSERNEKFLSFINWWTDHDYTQYFWYNMTMSEISEIQKPGFPSCPQQNFEFILKSWFWNTDKDSIAWHPTEHFYTLSSTFLLMSVICVNCCPTQFRTGQTNNMSECAVLCIFLIWTCLDLTPGSYILYTIQAATNTGPTSQLKLGFVTTLSINYT